MRAQIYRTLLILFFTLFQASPAAFAAESEIEQLRKEVRELNQTVNKLTGIDEKQNQRIDDLEGKTTSGKKSAETPLAQEPSEVKPTKAAKAPQQKTEEVTASGPSPAPASSDEVQSLLDRVNNAPAVPGSNTRTLGLWKVPVGGGTASKLLPDISVIGSFAGAYFTQDPTGNVGPDPARTGFTLQEVELALSGVVDPYFRYDAFLSFAEEGLR
jgi:hypothetical protein